jgi:hypothetical protein
VTEEARVPDDPRTVLGHLADESRLRVFAAVLLGARDAETVYEHTGVAPADALRLLARLEAAGLVERRSAGWVALPERLRESVAASAPATSVLDHGVVDPEAAAVLRVFMPDGRLTQIPAARGKRLVVLEQMALVFEPGVRYPEREVDALLKAFHPDYAALRRYLVDEQFLAREGGAYWRVGGPVDV